MKICIVCSHGGHLTEVLQILDAFEGHEIFFVTYYGTRETEVTKIARAYFIKIIGVSFSRMIAATFMAFRILVIEKPQVIVSLGAEIALPFIYLGKLMRIRTIYIESWARVEDLSLTGRLVYPIADAFWVQWPQMLEKCGPKAKFHGSVI